jgi:hypothetical protein
MPEAMLTAGAYSTPDLWEAAFLRSRGARLTGTTRQGVRVLFEFEDKGTCQQLAIEYLNGGATNVSALKAAWNDLKMLIFDR